MDSENWAQYVQYVLTESLVLNELGHDGSRNGKRELGTACVEVESHS